MAMDKREKVNPLQVSLSSPVKNLGKESLSEDVRYDESQFSEEPLSSRVRHREMRQGDISFEDAYQRETIYVDRSLKPKLEQLIKQQKRSKTSLINEAIADLLAKHKQA